MDYKYVGYVSKTGVIQNIYLVPKTYNEDGLEISRSTVHEFSDAEVSEETEIFRNSLIWVHFVVVILLT
jgi:hypothetical protein